MTIEMYQLVNLSGEADGPLYKSIDEAREDADGTQAIDMITFEYSDRELVETPDGCNVWPPEYSFAVAPRSEDGGIDAMTAEDYTPPDGIAEDDAENAAMDHQFGGIVRRTHRESRVIDYSCDPTGSGYHPSEAAAVLADAD